MATIDDKVVAMSFESDKFEKGVNSTLSALDKLKAALHFPNAGKGLNDVNAAGKKVDFSHIGRSVDDIKDRLGAFRIVALATFAQIASRAIAAGGRFAKAFTLQPITAGFQEYSTNLNAIQTILANTQAAGNTLEDVNATLQELNRYSDKTIYNFSQMAKNIGTFTAAGVDLKTSTASIKGIANLAALSGSNAEQASTAMYQLSQAIAAGKVGLQDWNSVVNAGMGGTVFQRALAQTAETMGKVKKGAVELTGPMKNVSINGESFRQSLQAKPGETSWLTSDVLTATLKQFTSDMTDAELAAMGFNAAQIKAIQQTAKTAMFAATEVKTLSQVLDVAKETAGSGWAQTWQIIFGDFGEAKKTFTGLSNAVNGFINANADARNKVLGDWKALGGRTVLIDSIKTAFHNLGEILKPIKEAFRDIFPATTGKDLYNLTLRFQAFAEALKPSEQTVDNLKRTFRGLFALLDIGKQIISGIFTVFGRLFDAMGAGDGSFLNFTGNIGDFLVSLDKAMKKGDAFHNFFVKLGDILSAPIKMFKALAGAIGDLFGGFSPGGFSDQVSGLTGVMGGFAKVANAVADAWGNFIDSFSGSGAEFKPNFDSIIEAFTKLPTAIGKALANINFEAILAVIRTGLLGGIVLMLRNFLGKGSLLDQLSKGGGGILGNISGIFDGLRGSMMAMQTNIKADTLKKIAIAIGILTLSVVALSFVDPERLKSSLTAMAVGFGQLLGAMAILEKVSTSMGFIKMPFIAASMILLAGAIDVLAIAVIALSRLSWEELAKGLGATVVLLAAISAASVPLSANSAGMVRAGIGITAIAVAMKILASAVKDFAQMNMTQLGKGLGAVAVGLQIIARSMMIMPKSLLFTGAGLVAVSVGLRLLAGVVDRFGAMNWETMRKGLVGIGSSLFIIAAAMHAMPKTLPLTAAGLVLVSLALQGIARAVENMGRMSMKQMAKGLAALGGSLAILAVSMRLMKGTIGGSIALSAAASSLALLAPALLILGKMSWTQIVKGLAALAGALTIFGVAGAIISTTTPALIGLGAALVLVGGGLALAGAGIFLVSTGLSTLAVAGPAGIGILVAALVELTEAIPRMAKNLVLGLLEIVKGIAKTAPEFVKAIAEILGMVLVAIIKVTPKIADAFEALLKAGLKILHDNAGKVIKAGFELILNLLKGLRDNIDKIVPVVADIITKFLRSLADKAADIVRAGAQVLVSLLKGIAGGIADITAAAVSIITKFLSAIASNLAKVAVAGLSILTKLLDAIADNISKVIKSGTDVIVAWIKGMGDAGGKIVAAAVTTLIKFANALVTNAVLLADAGAKAIIRFMNGIADVIDKREPEMIRAGARIGAAIITGMIKGLGNLAPDLKKKIKEVAKSVPGYFKHLWDSHSPSMVFAEIGRNAMLGLALGMEDHKEVVKSATAMSEGVIEAVKKIFVITSPSKVMRDLGIFVVEGFAQGIRGTSDEVKAAFAEMNDKVTSSLDEIKAKIRKERETLIDLQTDKHPNDKAIANQMAVINSLYDKMGALLKVRRSLMNDYDDERTKLIALSSEYQKLGKKLEAAKDVLADAKRTRDDAIKGFRDQYSTLPDIVTEDAEGNAVNQLATYMGALDNQAKAVAAYQSTLDQLRKLGLDDATYQKLLAEGTADQQFATQLLSGGKTAVQSLNALDSQLMKVSKTLATNAGRNLYQAGVDAAEGLVRGLESKMSRIHKTMEAIARDILTTLKRELKIKSPSEEFEDIGKLSVAGLAQGLSQSSRLIQDAVGNAAADALSSLRKSIRNVSDLVSEELNPNPVITPVLDLTQVQKQAGDLATLTKTPIVPLTSIGQATVISSRQAQAQADQAAGETAPAAITFEQNNYSPEALSDVEIYRQTRNQLSRLRDVLVTP